MATPSADAARPAGANRAWTRRLREEQPALLAAAGAAVAAVAVVVDHLVPWVSQPLFVYAAVVAFAVAAVAALRVTSPGGGRWRPVLVADGVGAASAVTAAVVGEGTVRALVLALGGAVVTAGAALRASRSSLALRPGR